MTLYTIGCPQCKVLEKKMEQAGLTYELCSDMEVMKTKGLRSAPFLELDDGTMLDFSKAVKWVKEQA